MIRGFLARSSVVGTSVVVASLLALACGGSGSSGFGGDTGDGGSGNDSGTTGSDGSASNDGGPVFHSDGGTTPDASPSGDGGTTTTIYAHTDDTLYSMDPTTKAVSIVGKFASSSGTLGSVTDLAVNANDEVYVNTTTAIYKAALPSAPGANATVQLTSLATIKSQPNQKFYALAFAPAGVLGANETLVGGDGSGEVWSIDPANGAIKDLGNFGGDPNTAGNVLGLSGDIVFYNDASGKATGLATVRSCVPATSTTPAKCSGTSDYLVGIKMDALAMAYNSGTAAATLLAGIYGGNASMSGPGTGFGDVFGLGAWGGEVYGFTRNMTGSQPHLLLLDTSTGKGSVLQSWSTFTNGWSGAGVTTKVSVSVPPPPPPPPPK